VLALTADIGNFGANTGIVNFVSKYIQNDIRLAMSYLKIGLLFKIFMGFGVFIIGLLLSPFLAFNIFNKPEMTPFLRLAFLGVGTTWLFSFTTSYYQAVQNFKSWGIVQIFTNSLRLLGVVAVFYTQNLNIHSAMFFYIIAPLLGFIVGFVNIPFNFIREKIHRFETKSFFSFNKWVGISAIGGASSSRVDSFVLGRLVSFASIGIYSAANQLAQVVPQLIGAVGTVVAPKFSSFDSDKKMLEYFKKIQLYVAGISFAIILCIPLVKIVISIFFGQEYKSAFPIFVILLFAMLVFFISVPVHNAIIYYYSYPKLFSYLSFINLAVVFISAYLLTIKFGVSGTAYAVLLGNLTNFIIPLAWFLKRINKKLENSK
jgi:O-antigen/teichoic acid export membrane protein